MFLYDREIKHIMTKLESNPALMAICIQDVPVYSLCRFYIEYLIRENAFRSGGGQSAASTHTEKNTGFLVRRIRGVFNRLVTLKKKSSMLLKQQTFLAQFDTLENVPQNDYLVVATSDLHNKENYSTELEEVVDHFIAQKHPVYFVQPNYSLELRRHPAFRKYFPLDIRIREKYSAADMAGIKAFVQILSAEVEALRDLVPATLANIVFNQLSSAGQLDKILKAVKPKFVFSRSLYTEAWVVLACKRNHVKSVEIQHGAFLYENIYYHALNKDLEPKLLLPDYVGCTGNEWLRILRTQSSRWTDSNSFVIGDKQFRQLKKSPSRPGERHVLIAFQPSHYQAFSIAEDILKFFALYSQKPVKGISFSLRFHPLDSAQSYSELKQLHYPWLNISDSRQVTIYEDLSRADVLVTATSTSIYQALSIGVKVISFERFREMTIEKGVLFVNNAEELLKAIEDPGSEKEVFEYLSDTCFDFINTLK